MRIVSLLASGTETLCALGLEGALVGRSHECDWPESVLDLPQCTAPGFDVEGTSAEIDARIKQAIAERDACPVDGSEALSLYRVFRDRLAELAPDLIVTQSQCEVCAVSISDVERTLEGWMGKRPHVVSLSPHALSDVFADIQRVATAASVPERGRRLIDELQGRLLALGERVAGRPRPRVGCLEWLDPLMAAGNWVPELVAIAGGKSVFGVAGQHSPWLSWEELGTSDPDFLVAMPCGFDLARTRHELSVLAAQDGWNSLSAVRQGRVAAGDANRFFTRPGPRLVESARMLAEMLHPQVCDFGHRGVGWAWA